MKFNKDKCKDLQLGRNNARYQQMLGATHLETSLSEKDTGILVDTRLNMNHQWNLAAKNASDNLNCTRQAKCFQQTEGDDPFPSLYSTLVRQHLQCCFQFWVPSARETWAN